MTDISDRNAQATPSPLAGLVPSRIRTESESGATETAPRDRGRFARGMLQTVPIVLVGSMAVAGLNLSGPIVEASAKPATKPKAETVEHDAVSAAAQSSSRRSINAALSSANAAANPVAQATTQTAAATVTVTETAPSTYRVQGGDTVSSIAGRYGLSTASVLALNGLGWKSVIFPGQSLKLTNAVVSTAAAVTTTVDAAHTEAQRYTIETGDTVSSIATKFGVTIQAILTANGLGWSSVIFAGRTLTIPGSTTAAADIQTVAAVTPDASTTVTETYTIKSGDTLSSIASQFGVTVDSLLSANNLMRTSIIFGGQSLNIARGTATVSVAAAVVPTADTATSVTPLTEEMEANAATIIRVGQELGAPDYGIIIALAAAMQESSLRNLDSGDRDSVGLFQQRPSTGWGTKEQLLSTDYAARLFYGGVSNPNAGITRGLFDISNWAAMSVTAAAQQVQISAYPNAYAKWETSARAWYAALR